MFLCKLLVGVVFPHFCFVAVALLAGFATSCGFFSSLLTMFLSCPPAAPCTYITSQFYKKSSSDFKMGFVFFCSIYIAHNTCVYNVCACVSMFLKLSNTGLRSHKVCFASPHVFIASFKNLLPLPRKPSVIRI